jgi:long-chain fatty acid transport protein
VKITAYTSLGLWAFSAVVVSAGGWETGKLDTSFIYNEGSYAELSYGNLDYSVSGTTQAGVSHDMAKDQTRMSLSGKFQVGSFDIGLTSFSSGAIQMDGQNASGAGCLYPTAPTTCSVVPSADVSMDTQAILSRYKINENFSVIGGIRQVNLKDSSVTTLGTTYNIDATSKTGRVYGLAYERPEIALRLEVLRSEKMTFGLNGNAMSGVAPITGSGMAVPEATTISFQTGIAKDTLLTASAHRVLWAASQINVLVPAAGTALDISSDFADTTSYSLGIGRALSDATAVNVSYSWEAGSGATSTDPFKMSNGSKTLSLGVRHTIADITLSAGIGYTQAGDVNVTHMAAPTIPSGLTATYENNSVVSFGVKVGYSF